MSTNPQLRQETAQDIRLRRDMERQIDNDAGRAKIIETFAEIQEAEAKGETVPSWENDENQEEYNFIFRNGQEFNVIAPTLDFAKKQCQLFLEDPLTGIKVGDDWEVFDVEITDLEEDMIEVTLIDNSIIYIDFAYKGIPDDIPIEKIVKKMKSGEAEQIAAIKASTVKKPLESLGAEQEDTKQTGLGDELEQVQLQHH